jgi:hypothetical protein
MHQASKLNQLGPGTMYFKIAPGIVVCNIFVLIIDSKVSEDFNILSGCVYIEYVIEGRMNEFERM